VVHESKHGVDQREHHLALALAPMRQRIVRIPAMMTGYSARP
jgi:hypothetical protein